MSTKKTIGGEFGIESSIIALLAYVIVTIATICMIKKREKGNY